MADAKIEFCKRARAAIEDEKIGEREYGELINVMFDWEDENKNVKPEEEVVIHHLTTAVTKIRNDESGHRSFFERVVAAKCQGI